MNVCFVAVDEEHGLKVSGEAPYRDTGLDQLSKTYLAVPMMRAVTENISEGGLCLVSDKPLPVGTHVIVDIHLPKVGDSVRALARVRRLEGSQSSDATSCVHRVGLELMALNKDSLNRLQTLIMQRLRPPARYMTRAA